MDLLTNAWTFVSTLAPIVLMLTATALALSEPRSELIWKRCRLLSMGALLSSIAALVLQYKMAANHAGQSLVPVLTWLAICPIGAWMSVLVQLLGTVIIVFSSRYLEGEARQARYAASLTSVLAAVQLLLLSNHWVLLIAAWAAVGVALEQLLCFYEDRPFALLSAHKKRIADRMADTMLLVAAALACWDVGSGLLSDLWQHLSRGSDSLPLQLSAVCLVLAIVLRMALFPVHGWLIQVMEAPTPVSALLHAGVVNLGGFLLIRFAPLLEVAPTARWLLLGFGLVTALFAGLVMLTRVSIKVRLAWSTVAQMGFMVLECGLGLYTLAVLHLIGHSLYKAHAFLAAATIVQDSKLKMMRGKAPYSTLSLMLAPVIAALSIWLVQIYVTGSSFPWWWNGVLALSWAPLLWLPKLRSIEFQEFSWRGIAGLTLLIGLTVAASLAHGLAFGVQDKPDQQAGILALSGMIALYICLAILQFHPQILLGLRRWAYSGFYIDEFYTRAALQLFPTRWTPLASPQIDHTLESTNPVAVK